MVLQFRPTLIVALIAHYNLDSSTSILMFSESCCRYSFGRLICTRHSAKSSSEKDEWLGDTGMDGIAYLHVDHCFNLQVAAPSADATLLASIVANLSTETVPARGLRAFGGEVLAVWSNTLAQR